MPQFLGPSIPAEMNTSCPERPSFLALSPSLLPLFLLSLFLEISSKLTSCTQNLVSDSASEELKLRELISKYKTNKKNYTTEPQKALKDAVKQSSSVSRIHFLIVHLFSRLLHWATHTLGAKWTAETQSIPVEDTRYSTVTKPTILWEYRKI